MRIISDKLFHPPSLSKKTLVTLIALIVWSFFLWRAFNVFGPSGAANDISFNSDSAIPVLMSNDERPITIFNLYYYGADRWGGWPFLVTQFIRRATGYKWSDQSIFMLQAIWVFIGALVIAGLNRRAPFVAALAYLVTLCLHNQSRFRIFELSQVYGWQTTALLIGWYSLRRFFESSLKYGGKHSKWDRAAWLLPAFVFSFLAVWSSNASIPFLFFLLHLEGARAWFEVRARPLDKMLLKTYALGLASISAATFSEWTLKWNYHRHALKHYGSDFRTNFNLDTGHLAENFSQQLHNLTKLSWWPLYLLPTLALITLASLFIYALLKKRNGLLEKLRTIFADDTMVLAIGAYLIAAINFALSVLVDHIRRNYYDDRFLTLTNLFGPVSGILILFLLFKLAVKKSSGLTSIAQPAFVLTCVVLMLIKFPAAGYDPAYIRFKSIALDLARKTPRAVLMGSYWDTYVFAALQPDNMLTPVPLEGQEVRMPWLRESVRRADQVLVSYNHLEQGSLLSPPDRLQQYGASLRLVDPKWYEFEGYFFALYVNETR